MRHQCPLLWELLTLEVYTDRTARQLPTVVVERCLGGYQVTLQDHASNQQCAARSATLQGLWSALEDALPQEHCWRPYKSRKVRDPSKRRELPKKG